MQTRSLTTQTEGQKSRQTVFFHENGTEKISLPFASFKSLQTADEENRREEFKTTGRLNCSRKNNGIEKGNAQSSSWDM